MDFAILGAVAEFESSLIAEREQGREANPCIIVIKKEQEREGIS
jgi:hypothetical protein